MEERAMICPMAAVLPWFFLTVKDPFLVGSLLLKNVQNTDYIYAMLSPMFSATVVVYVNNHVNCHKTHSMSSLCNMLEISSLKEQHLIVGQNVNTD